jgi:organic radical activating enzyme
MELTLNRVGIYVTMRCNLRCKLCSSYTPYYSDPWHPEIEKLCRQIDRLFDLVSYINRIHIVGGEPFFRDDLNVLIEELKKYKSRIGEIEIVTNGTIVPNPFIFEVLKLSKMNIKISINNYGILSRNFTKLYNELRAKAPNIRIKTREAIKPEYFWVNFNLCDKGRSRDEQQEIFNTCHLPHKMGWDYFLQDSVIYRCPQLRRIAEVGLGMPDSNEAIDISDAYYSDEELKAKILKGLSLPVFSACKYCDGQRDGSVWYKPAEQV